MPRWIRTFSHLNRMPEVWRAFRCLKDPLRVTQRYVGAGQSRYPVEVRTRSGLQIRADNHHDLVTIWVVFCRGEYDVPPDAKLIFDLGANIGCFTLLASERAPASRIVSVEPFPSTFARLKESVCRAGLENRVFCLEAAIAPKSGMGVMDADPGGVTQSRGMLAPGAAGVPVATIDLSTLFQRAITETGVEQIDLVKMDIEGFEHTILPRIDPSVLANVRRWQMEYHPNEPKGPLFEGLGRAGLQCIRDYRIGKDAGVAHFARRQ